MFPLESSVAVDEGVCVPCDPAPVTMAVDVKLAAEVTHVAQAMVPVLVIVPPVIGLVVAMLVTVPLPPPALWHAPSAPRYCVPLQVENRLTTSAAAAAVRLPLLAF